MMTMNEVSFNRQEVVAGFRVVLGFCWLRPYPVRVTQVVVATAWSFFTDARYKSQWTGFSEHGGK